VQDDATKASWVAALEVANDRFGLYRSPPGSGSVAPLLTLDATGVLTLPSTATYPQLVLGNVTGKGRVLVGNDSALQLSSNHNVPTGVQDDTARPSWVLNLGGTNDFSTFSRRAVSNGSWITNLQVQPTGDLIIAGANAQKSAGTSWINPSDPRLKDDVMPYTRGLADILGLEPIAYRLKANRDRECYGFDAAAVRDVFPECVSETRMKLDPDDDEETDGVLLFDMHPILVTMVTAIKELAAKVAMLEAR
jgi:hypothetical protein